MPYSGPNDPDLPSNVQDKPLDDREQWVAVWNKTFKDCVDDGGSEDSCETKAFATANGVIKENAMAGLTNEETNMFGDLLRYIAKRLRGESKDRAMALMDMADSVWSQVFDDTGGWLMDIFVENDRLFAVVSNEGKLYSVPVSVTDGSVSLGERTEIELDRSVGRVLNVQRQADGRLRVTTIACTAVLNRIGEIDSRALFDSFVENLDSEKMPIVNFHHLGDEARLGEVDYAARDGYTYILSYLFDDNEFGEAAARGFEADPEYWGHSIEFTPTDGELVEIVDGVSVPVFTSGVNTGVAILGEQRAAALFTSGKVTQGVMRMDQNIKDELLKLMDGNEDIVNEFEEIVDGTNRHVTKEKLVARSTEVEEEEEAETEEVEDETETVEGETEEVEEETEAEDVETETAIEETEVVLEDDALQTIADHILASDTFAELVGDQVREANAPVTERLDELLTRMNEATGQNAGLFKAVEKRLDQLEKPQAELRQEWVQDLPKQPARKVIVRPSKIRGKSTEGMPDMAGAASEVHDKWQTRS